MALFLTPLGAEITADYVPDSYVVFTTGSPPFLPTDFVAHLGTLTLNITGNHLFNPSLIDLSLPNYFSFTGPVLTGGTYTQQTTHGAILCSVSKVKNKAPTISQLIPPNTTLPLSTASGNYNTSVFVAELYILGSRDASKYKEGELYTITGGDIGAFNVGTTSSGSSSQTPEYVPVNGQEIPEDGTPPPPVPISPATTVPLPYIDPDHTSPDVQYFLSIIEETSFDLQNVLQFNACPIIARAMLVLYQAVEGTTYGVNIQFSKLPGSASFALRPSEDPIGHAIPYQLSFRGQPVFKDSPIPWTPLSCGVNYENICIYSVSSAEANAAPTGSYEDTIVVTVSPIE